MDETSPTRTRIQTMWLQWRRAKPLHGMVCGVVLLSGCARQAIPVALESSALQLSSSSLSYAATYVGGTSPSQAATLTNNGNLPLGVQLSVTGVDFSQMNSCPTELPPQASCTVWVSFAPAAAGTRAGTLAVLSDAITPVPAALSGMGVANPPVTFGKALNTSTVFMGASIVQYWPMPLNNRGISGQVTTQMLARFAADVLGRGFERVVILGGSNDITSGFPLDPTVSDIAAMAQLARGAGLEVVLSQLPPITLNGVSFNSQVLAANAAIRTLTIENGYLVVDFYTPMAGHPEYFLDGEHPNAAGYAVMEAALAATVSR